MSHDRGCHCGKERYEYDECRDKECSRSPLYDAEYHAKKVCERLGRKYLRGIAPVDCPALVANIEAPGGYLTAPASPESFTPDLPDVIVRQPTFDRRELIVTQSAGGRPVRVPKGEVEIDGPCRVRVVKGRMEVVVNHRIAVRWTAPARKAKKAKKTTGAPR